MKNKKDREKLTDAIIKETYGLKKSEMGFFLGSLASNLAHNLPVETSDQIIASFKQSRDTVKDIVLSLKESGMVEIK